MAPAKSLHIGVFFPSPPDVGMGAQLLDTACVDIFGTLSHNYLEGLGPYLPSHDILAHAPVVTISYVGTSPAGSVVPLTAEMKIQLTHHFSDADVAPGRLDIVIVPGPDPREQWAKDALAWLKAHADTPQVDILSICTGVYVCGAAGLLTTTTGTTTTGKKVCGPSAMQGDLRARFGEEVQWVGHELRWTRDGNFWSSGGVTNGNDLVAAYCRESGRFAPHIVEMALKMMDVGDRPQRYDTPYGANSTA